MVWSAKDQASSGSRLASRVALDTTRLRPSCLCGESREQQERQSQRVRWTGWRACAGRQCAGGFPLHGTLHAKQPAAAPRTSWHDYAACRASATVGALLSHKVQAARERQRLTCPGSAASSGRRCRMGCSRWLPAPGRAQTPGGMRAGGGLFWTCFRDARSGLEQRYTQKGHGSCQQQPAAPMLHVRAQSMHSRQFKAPVRAPHHRHSCAVVVIGAVA